MKTEGKRRAEKRKDKEKAESTISDTGKQEYKTVIP